MAVELLWFASIPLLGKEGFKEVKQRTFGWLKLPSSPVSQTRHRIGVMLLFGSLLLNVLLNLIMVGVDLFVSGPDQPNPVILGLSFEQQTTVYIATQILTSIGVMVAMFMLGGDFWERLKKAFEWHG